MKEVLSTYYFDIFQAFYKLPEGIKVTALNEHEARTEAKSLLDNDGHNYRLVTREVKEGIH